MESAKHDNNNTLMNYTTTASLVLNDKLLKLTVHTFLVRKRIESTTTDSIKSNTSFDFKISKDIHKTIHRLSISCFEKVKEKVV
jgi:acyl CoA:acetate/3-ketoacid CoA transferase beta subunit